MSISWSTIYWAGRLLYKGYGLAKRKHKEWKENKAVQKQPQVKALAEDIEDGVEVIDGAIYVDGKFLIAFIPVDGKK